MFAAGRSLLGVAIIGIAAIISIDPAESLPSFARQTGQPCGTCHTDFPGLTPYGRQFKLLGYTTGGGQFRTTIFPNAADDAKRAMAAVIDGESKKIQAAFPTKAPPRY